MCGRCESCFITIGSAVCVLTPQMKKTQFLKAFELKKLFSYISGELGVRFPFCFIIQLSLDVWEVWVMFHSYRIYGLHFDPPNPKNSVLESLWVEKAIFMHIWRTESPIPILFLHKTFFRCVGGVIHVSWLLDLRFLFWPPKLQKLNFWKPIS